MAALMCPFCSVDSGGSGFSCAACGRSLVLLGRWRLESLLERGNGTLRYAARDSQNPYAPIVDAWIAREPSLLDASGALAVGNEDGGIFVVVRPPPAVVAAFVAPGHPRRRGSGVAVVIAAASVFAASVAAGVVLMQARAADPATSPFGGTTCNKPMSISSQNLTEASDQIVATDGCDLVIHGCNLTAPQPLVVRGHARARIDSCNVNGNGSHPSIQVFDQGDVTVVASNVNGVYVHDQGKLEATSSIVVGPVTRDDGASLVGAEENPPRVHPGAAAGAAPVATTERSSAPARPDWSRHACDAVAGCYQTAKAFGHASGTLTVRIAASGRAVSATYSGPAPAVVQRCLHAAGMAASLEGYTGPPGKLTCSWDGTIMQGSEMMMQDSDFVTAAGK